MRLSFLVESPVLYLAFFKTILAALFRAFSLPLSLFPSKPSFLHDHSTTQHLDFSSFLAISTTDKPVYRLMLSRGWTFLRFVIFTKNKKGAREIRAMKYKKYVAKKYTRARTPLAQKYTNRILESKDGTTSMEIVNYIERHNFCWNDLLTMSNRTEKVEERTFGTPCIDTLFASQ